MPPVATPQALRTAITDLAVLADNDLDALWRQVTTAEQARDALLDVLPDLIATYGLASAAISADWYDDVREEVGARGRFTAIPAEQKDLGADKLATWAVGPLFTAEPDWARARTLVKGGMQLRIANASRSTVAGSAIADPGADGWMRQGSGECAWCSVLIGRGAVYSEASADFAAHDHCRCSAVPAFGGKARPVKEYTPSPRKNRADYDRARQWMRENGYA